MEENLYYSDFKYLWTAEHKTAGIWYFTDRRKLDEVITNKEGWDITYDNFLWSCLPERRFTNPTRNDILKLYKENMYWENKKNLSLYL